MEQTEPFNSSVLCEVYPGPECQTEAQIRGEVSLLHLTVINWK